jgi:hypothetical protein
MHRPLRIDARVTDHLGCLRSGHLVGSEAIAGAVHYCMLRLSEVRSIAPIFTIALRS